MLNWIFKFLLGDDIFISYSRADGATYAAGLANELTKLKFSCKLDQWGTESGAEMPESLKKSLKRSAVLVLVGTDGAAKSRHVGSEIDEFKKIGRMVIPIVFDGILLKNGLIYRDGEKQQTDSALPETEATWAGGIEGLPISWEKLENLKTGNPSPENVSRIEKTFTFSRKDERLRKTSLAAAIFLLLLLVASAAASVVAFAQTKNAAAATSLATEKEQIANQKTKDADEATEKANFEADRALKNEEIANQKTEEARVKTEEADKATKRAEEEKAKADKASKLAAEKTKLADVAQKEAEKQAKLADEKRKEAEAFSEKSRRLSYATNIQLAARLYDSAQVEAFTDVLNGTDENLRGFEWNYLKHLPEGMVKFNKTEEERVGSLMFSPDGKYLVSGGSDLLLWNPKTGEKAKLEVPENLNKEGVIDFAFSPKGERFVALFKNNILVWNVSNWEKLKFSPDAKFDFPGGEDLKSVTFGESVDELLTVSANKEEKYFVRRWNISAQPQAEGSREIKLTDKKPVQFEVLKVTPDGKAFVSYKETDDENAVEQLSLLDTNLKETKLFEGSDATIFDYYYVFSGTGKRIAVTRGRPDTPNHESIVYVLDVSNNKELMSIEGNAQDYVAAVAFSSDEKKLAVLYMNFIISVNKIMICDIDKKQTERIIPFISESGDAVAFSPDNSEIAAALDTLTLYDANSNQDVFTFNNEQLVKLSSDGTRAITANSEGYLILWDTVKRESIKKFDIKREFLVESEFSPDVKYFVTRQTADSGDSAFPLLQLWDAATGEEIKLALDTKCKFSTGIGQRVFSDTSKRLAVFCEDGTVRIWNLENQNGIDAGKEFSRLQMEKALVESEKITVDYETHFLPDDKKIEVTIVTSIRTGGGPTEESKDIQIWDVESRTRLHPEVCSEKIFKFSPDGEWMITIDEKNNYRLRNMENKRCDEKPLISNDEITDVNFSNDGRFLVVSYLEGLIWVGNLTKTTIREVIPQQKADNFSMEFSPLSRWLRAGDKYWNTGTGESFTIHGCTKAPKFSIDEKRLITSCEDGTLKLWSMDSGQEVLSIKAHNDSVRDAVLMEGNKYLLTASDDSFKLWRTQF